MNMSDDIQLSSPDEGTAEILLPVARRIFTDTFAHLFEQDAFEVFCDQAYANDGPMAQDFNDPEVFWQIAACSGTPIGYAKVTPLRAPASAAKQGALELQQIYVLAQWQGSGVAEELMLWALSVAERALAPELYLTVFDHNERAKRFYARHGFSEVGRCTFTLGDRVYDDRIWRRDLVPDRTRRSPQPSAAPR